MSIYDFFTILSQKINYVSLYLVWQEAREFRCHICGQTLPIFISAVAA